MKGQKYLNIVPLKFENGPDRVLGTVTTTSEQVMCAKAFHANPFTYADSLNEPGGLKAGIQLTIKRSKRF